ncbi:endospore germination permease [Neobacillus mesonae]|uniref:GerAB/ArcD/ProY family transporter n=1 Tax=Neobacillus mesonae TaxID=1193713 RepID=UPI00203C1320|nr:endospore germination permease [Neobacillus mesonae]MCM3567270.1 endospore germination permease [Neobacillus mesonae]
MARNEKDYVGYREIFAIVFLTVGSKATDMNIVLLFEDGLNAAWMIVIGSFLLIVPSLFLLNLVMKKYETKNLLEIIQLTLGKPAALLIGLVFLLYVLIVTASDTRSYVTQLITINFPNTPLFVIYLCFLLLCLWGAKKGWESVASIAWMILPYLLLSIGFLAFLLLREGEVYRTFPLFGTGKWEIAKASFKYTYLYSEAFLLAMMYPFVKNHQNYTKGLYSSLGFAVIFMAFMYLSYLWVFDFRSVGKITYPFNEAIRLVSLGRTIANIETFFITVWLVGVFVKFMVYIFFLCKIFGFVFRIDEYEYVVVPITLLILVMGMIPENNEVNMFFIRKGIAVYFKYVILFLPPLLWGVTKIKGAKG